VQDARTPGIHAVSALTGDGIPALLEAITAALDEERTEETLMLSFSNGRGRAWLHDESVVTGETQTDEGYEIAVRWTARQKARFNAL
jgi:GTP-binding protein HflX